MRKKYLKKMQTNDNNKITTTKTFYTKGPCLKPKAKTAFKNINLVKRNEKNKVEKMQTNNNN